MCTIHYVFEWLCYARSLHTNVYEQQSCNSTLFVMGYCSDAPRPS